MRTFVFHMDYLLLVFLADIFLLLSLAIEWPCPAHDQNNAQGLETIIFMCWCMCKSSTELLHNPLLVNASYLNVYSWQTGGGAAEEMCWISCVYTL